MNGQSFPTGAMMPSPLGTYNDPELETRYPVRPRRREASCWPTPATPTASRSTLDCPNNRYINDEEICIALAGDVGADQGQGARSTRCRARPTSRSLEKYDFSMYMLGWGGSVTDAETTLTPVLRNNLGEKGIGFYNYGHARNDKLDALAAQSSTEADPKKREELIKAALTRVQASSSRRMPLHRQVIPWAARTQRQRRPPRRQLARGVLGDDRQMTRRAPRAP